MNLINIFSYFSLFILGANANAQWSQKGSTVFGNADYDLLGTSLDMSADGETIIVGNIGYSAYPGKIKVYNWNGTSWQQKGTTILGDNNGDEFGKSVKISEDGKVISAGAWRNNDNGQDAGLVKIFEWNGSDWIQKGATLFGPGASDTFGFGHDIDSSGNSIAIGGYNNSDSNVNSGHIEIYEWNGSNWVQKGTDIYGQGAGSRFGYSVAFSNDGKTVAGGAPFYNSQDGYVEVFYWNGTDWQDKGNRIDADWDNERCGIDVKLSNDGETIIVGSDENSELLNLAGHARVFDFISNDWVQRGDPIYGNSASSKAGGAVDISSNGQAVVIGSPNNSSGTPGSGSGSHDGQVNVYIWQNGSWTPIFEAINGNSSEDYFGTSVAISDDGYSVAGGAPEDEQVASGFNNRGSFAVFESTYTLSLLHEPSNYLSIYPNPAQNTVNIQTNTNIENVTVYDQSGKLLLTTTAASTRFFQLDIFFLDAGVYFIQCQTDKGLSHHTLIKD